MARQGLVLLAAAAASLWALPAAAEVTSSTGSGSSRAYACQAAKTAAGIAAGRAGSVQEYGRCGCDDNGSEGSSYRWSCTVDAYYEPYKYSGGYGSGGYGTGGYTPRGYSGGYGGDGYGVNIHPRYQGYQPYPPPGYSPYYSGPPPRSYNPYPYHNPYIRRDSSTSAPGIK
ncbi:hypothetical protein HHL28_11095 [Aerophototrophica crusticola]|uniref:Uncharacterized protein n=1 Tax=Aerophototrophica crusticola TaxID=1709002 RepID=A0A858R800_9PROT|nr:hypothetical protein HHL28_11095 [Rhodospirillaceae bacterium B3]